MHLDFCYEIEKRFIKGLRSVFEKDVNFNYNSNIQETNLLITSDFNENEEVPLHKPQILVTGISRNVNTQNMFANNFYRDVKLDGCLSNQVKEYAYIIPYSATLICSSSSIESKDLASRTESYLTFYANDYFSERLGLNLTTVSIGGTNPSKQYPEKIFDTTISVQGTFYWIGRSQKGFGIIDEIDKPLVDIKINTNEILEF